MGAARSVKKPERHPTSLRKKEQRRKHKRKRARVKVGVSRCTQSASQFGKSTCALQAKKPLEETKAEKRNASGRRGKTAKNGVLRARAPKERQIKIQQQLN